MSNKSPKTAEHPTRKSKKRCGQPKLGKPPFLSYTYTFDKYPGYIAWMTPSDGPTPLPERGIESDDLNPNQRLISLCIGYALRILLLVWFLYLFFFWFANL